MQLAGAADDRGLTPVVKGMTDELTMADWDPPFPFDAKRIRPADEQYWDRYGPTPKAFVSLATGRRLWGSRFGQTTSIRVGDGGAEKGEGGRAEAAEGRSLSTIHYPLATILQQRLDPAAMGFVFQPVKRQGLAASAGTTPFGVLFLCFSFFIIAAAVMLVALLFRLGIEQRAIQDRHAAGRRLAASPGGASAAGRRARSWPPPAACWACRRDRLRRADAAGAAHLVAGRRRHAVPAAPSDGRQPGDRLA